MPSPFKPMLLSPAKTPPAGPGWVHEPKLDGWRLIVDVTAGRVRAWSRTGKEWTAAVPELEVLAGLGDAALDGELVAVTADGRADFGLLTARMNGGPACPVTFYAFDLLRCAGQDLAGRPWTERRDRLDRLDLAVRSAGTARPTVWEPDGAVMHQATADTGLEGTVSKQARSAYRPGRSSAWVKAKHRVTATFEVAGWKPPTGSRPGGLILAEGGEPVGVAPLGLPRAERVGLLALAGRYGRRHPSGTVTLPGGCLEAVVRFSSRTPTHRLLREPSVVAVRPATGPPAHQAAPHPDL